jgi:hypothetical protein
MGLVYRPARHSALKSRPNSSHHRALIIEERPQSRARRGGGTGESRAPGRPTLAAYLFLSLGWDRTNPLSPSSSSQQNPPRSA